MDPDQRLPDGTLLKLTILEDKLNQLSQITCVIDHVSCVFFRLNLRRNHLIIIGGKFFLNRIDVESWNQSKIIKTLLILWNALLHLVLPVFQLCEQLYHGSLLFLRRWDLRHIFLHHF